MNKIAEWRERFLFWRELHIEEFPLNPIGRLRSCWWRFQEWRRSKNPELVELDAFRGLIDLERKLEEWPRAIPLLEQALKLYDITQQPSKREAICKRLEAVDPTNPKVQRQNWHRSFTLKCRRIEGASHYGCVRFDNLGAADLPRLCFVRQRNWLLFFKTLEGQRGKMDFVLQEDLKPLKDN